MILLVANAASPLDVWTVERPLTNYQGTFGGICYGLGKFVAVGTEGKIAASRDGFQWTESQPTSNSLTAVSVFQGNFIAVGAKGSLFRSKDAARWTKAEVGEDHLYAIGQSDSRLMVVGNQGTVLISRDGFNWTRQASGVTNLLRGVAFGNNRFVAVGDSGTRLISTNNGADWSLVQQEDESKVDLSIAFGNGRFVIVSINIFRSGSMEPIPTFSVSTNGIHWRDWRPQAAWVRTVSFVRDQFIIDGRTENTAESRTIIFSSKDGENWERRVLQTFAEPFDFAFGNELIVAGATFGSILRSGPFLKCTLKSDPLMLELVGPVPGVYRIEHSFDLWSWKDFTNVYLTNSPQTVPIEASASIQRQFFRAKN